MIEGLMRGFRKGWSDGLATMFIGKCADGRGWIGLRN